MFTRLEIIVVLQGFQCLRPAAGREEVMRCDAAQYSIAMRIGSLLQHASFASCDHLARA